MATAAEKLAGNLNFGALGKAKELRKVAEPLITLAKQDSLTRRRLAYSRIQDKKAVKKLFEELGPRFKNRPGGYMRILKHGFKKTAGFF